jgi:hypothetical protein
MGLYQILTNPQNFKFYAEKSFPNVNAVSSTTSFGQKSIGYGDTNQPYIQIPFPENATKLNPIDYDAGSVQFNFNFDPTQGFQGGNGNLIDIEKGNLFSYLGSVFKSAPDRIRYNARSWGPDFLNRGNLFGFVRALDDTKRLTRYFFDRKSISGNFFVAKQNILSRIAVKTEASTGPAYGLGAVNAGIYTPASTIGQAAISVIEGHLLKQGIDPTGLVNSLSIKTYQQALTPQLVGGIFPNKNRLIKLSKLSYSNEVEVAALNIASPYNVSANTDYFISYGGGPNSFLGIGKTKLKYATDNTGNVPLLTLSKRGLSSFDGRYSSTTYTPDPLTWDRKDLAQASSSMYDESPKVTEDFRKQLLDTATIGQQTFLSLSPSYKIDALNTGNIEKRTNFRGAGARGNLRNFQAGKKSINAGKVLGPTDLINAFPIYQGTTPSNNDLLKDMVDFRIGIYDNDTIGLGGTIKLNWMHFRVLLDDFSDSYGADWKAISYMGRAENFYKYDSFKRDISIGFTVAAQSKQELLPIYKKLNYLASSLAPSYSDNGFIRGNLSQITLGNWLFEQPGFISSVDLSIPDDSPWEINLPLDGKTDEQVKQVPHMVNVKIKFTPIHKFRPEINKLSNLQDASKFSENNILYKNPTYGPQRYIALLDSESDAYDTPLIDPAQLNQQNNPGAAQSNQSQNQLGYGPGENTSYLPSPQLSAIVENTPPALNNPDATLGNQGLRFK